MHHKYIERNLHKMSQKYILVNNIGLQYSGTSFRTSICTDFHHNLAIKLIVVNFSEHVHGKPGLRLTSFTLLYTKPPLICSHLV